MRPGRRVLAVIYRYEQRPQWPLWENVWQVGAGGKRVENDCGENSCRIPLPTSSAGLRGTLVLGEAGIIFIPTQNSFPSSQRCLIILSGRGVFSAVGVWPYSCPSRNTSCHFYTPVSPHAAATCCPAAAVYLGKGGARDFAS